MVAIDMEMPHDCGLNKNVCPLTDDKGDCVLLPESPTYKTFAEQFKHCPLIDLTQYEDDGK